MRPKYRKDYRQRRHRRIRKRICGTADRPRMAIFVSNRRFQVQFIDDDLAITLASAESKTAEGGRNRETAKVIGARAAEAAVACGIKDVLVDRGGFRYHGCVQQIVESAVAGGLNILSETSRKRKETEAS